jgi:hypothetical protein
LISIKKEINAKDAKDAKDARIEIEIFASLAPLASIFPYSTHS